MKTDDYKQVREIQLAFGGKIGKNVVQRANQEFLMRIARAFSTLAPHSTNDLARNDRAKQECGVSGFRTGAQGAFAAGVQIWGGSSPFSTDFALSQAP
jgi:hypothetical protein